MVDTRERFALYDGAIEPDLPVHELIIWYCELIERKLDATIAKTKMEPSRP
jgi:hypothetical protein